MPSYNYTNPQGQSFTLDVDEELQPDQVYQRFVDAGVAQAQAPQATTDAGYLSQLGSALSIGAGQMASGVKATFNAATGDIPDTAAAMAQMGALQKEQQANLSAEDIALNEAFARNKAEYDQARGILPTIGALSGYVGSIASQPGAAFKQAIQSAPNAIIGAGTGLAGYALGGLVGAGAGIETGPGAVLTGIAGAAAGGAISNSLMEAGPAIYDILNERTNGAASSMTADQITQVLQQNPDIMSEGLKTGAIRGSVIGVIEGLGMKGAGRLMSIPERAAARAVQKTLIGAGVDVASKEAVESALLDPALKNAVSAAAKTAQNEFTSAGNLARLAGASGIEIGASGAGEVGAQVATGQEIDPTAAVQEMMGEVGLSIPVAAVAKGLELARTPQALQTPIQQALAREINAIPTNAVPPQTEEEKRAGAEAGNPILVDPQGNTAAVAPEMWNEAIKRQITPPVEAQAATQPSDVEARLANLMRNPGLTAAVNTADSIVTTAENTSSDVSQATTAARNIIQGVVDTPQPQVAPTELPAVTLSPAMEQTENLSQTITDSNGEIAPEMSVLPPTVQAGAGVGEAIAEDGQLEPSTSIEDQKEALKDIIALKKGRGQDVAELESKLQSLGADTIPDFVEVNPETPLHPFTSEKPLLPIKVEVSDAGVRSIDSSVKQIEKLRKSLNGKLARASGANKFSIESDIYAADKALQELGRVGREIESYLKPITPQGTPTPATEGKVTPGGVAIERDATKGITFRYEMRARPPSIGTHPENGFVSHEEGGTRHGFLTYDRPLTEQEIYDYELKPVATDSTKPTSVSSAKPTESGGKAESIGSEQNQRDKGLTSSDKPDNSADRPVAPKKGDLVTVALGGREYPKTRIINVVNTLEGVRYQVDVFGSKFVPESSIVAIEKPVVKDATKIAATPQIVRQLGDIAVKNKQPLDQGYIDSIGGNIPQGYVKQGDLYVFSPQTTTVAPPITPQGTPTPATEGTVMPGGSAIERDLLKPYANISIPNLEALPESDWSRRRDYLEGKMRNNQQEKSQLLKTPKSNWENREYNENARINDVAASLRAAIQDMQSSRPDLENQFRTKSSTQAESGEAPGGISQTKGKVGSSAANTGRTGAELQQQLETLPSISEQPKITKIDGSSRGDDLLARDTSSNVVASNAQKFAANIRAQFKVDELAEKAEKLKEKYYSINASTGKRESESKDKTLQQWKQAEAKAKKSKADAFAELREQNKGFTVAQLEDREPFMAAKTLEQHGLTKLATDIGYVRQGDLYVFSPQTTTVAAPTETAAPSAKEAAVASVVQQPVEGSIPTVEQESAITAIESTEKADVAKEAMRFLEADLTDAQRAKWTPEMFTAAQAFFDSGGKDFDSLKKAIKFPRVVQQAYLKADKEAAAEQTRREAADAAMAREVEKATKEQAKLEADQKQREELGLKTLNSLIKKTRTNVVQGTVKSSDANQAVAILNKSGAIPNVLFTWIGTSKDFLADPANRDRYPETWKAVSSNPNIEGMSENGQPIVFTDNVGVSDLDRNLAKLQGTTPEVAAVRRVILHENIHKGMFFLSLKDKMKLFQFLHRLYSPEELDQLAKSYDEYSDWRINQVSYFSIIEEAMTRDFDSMAEIPRDGIWAEFMQFLRDIWQKITGKTSEPTLKNYKDVFRLIRNSLKNSEAANADRLKNGGEVRMSMSEFFSNVTPEQDAAYAKAVADGDMETAQRMVDEAAKAAGYNVGPVYQGFPTDKGPIYKLGLFNDNIRTEDEKNRFGFFFSSSEEQADKYRDPYGRLGGTLRKVVLSGNILDLTAAGPNDADIALKIMSDNGVRHGLDADEYSMEQVWRMFFDDGSKFRKALKKAGFDGVSFNEVNGYRESITTAVLNPNQIKSAYPITRDDSGNVIPLSRRFQTASNDIRFSKVEYDSPNEAAFNSGAEVARNADYDERDKAVRSTIREAYDLAPKDNGPSVPLDQLFDIAKQSMPDLTENEFSQILQDLYEDSGALLQAGESPFIVTTPDGQRAGSVIIVSSLPTGAMASIVDSPATNEFTQSVDDINNGTAKDAFSGRQFKDFKPIDRTVKSAEEYSDVAIKYVNNLEKEGVSLEDIANSVISPVFLESIGIEQDLMAQDALTIEVRQRVDNASRKEKSPGRKKQLSKLSERLSAFWQGVGSKKGQHLGQRRYLVNKARYSWMFIRELAEKAMKEARTNILISNFGSENATSFTQNSYADSDKANQQSVDENINAAEEAQEFDQDAADLAAGEATLTGAFLKLYEELKDLLRELGILARLDTQENITAKASITPARRNELATLSKDERAKLREKNLKRVGEILNTLLGKESDANTPEKKTVRKKREKMVEVAKKRADKGQPIDPAETANDIAIRLLNEFENKLAQSAFFNSATKPDTIVKAFREQISDPMDRKAFKDRLMAMEVTSEMADRLFDKAARTKDNAQWKRAQDMLEGPNALRNIIREINRARPGDQAPLSKQIPWRELLSQNAKTVEEYRQRIFDAISANEELKSATPDQKSRLADLFAEAWEANRTRILDGMLERMIRAEEAKKNLSKEGAKALQEQRMRIVEDINLGIFDNDELAKRMAEKFGIKSEFTEMEREKINSLIEVLQDEGLNAVKRQVAAYKLLEVLQGELKIPVAKMLADFWVSSVLSGPNTIVSIGLAVASGAFELSTALSRVFIAGFTNQKQLPSELAGAYKTLARLLSAFGRQANIAWQYLVTGDPAFLDPSMNDVTENMQWGNIGKSNKLAEQMAKSDKILVKSAGLFMRTVSRLLTALDVFNSGLTKEGSLSIVFRQIGLDPEKIAALEKKSDLKPYKDAIIQKDFGGTLPKSARDKAIVDSYALADMMAELDKLGNVSENANFFGQQGAMTLDPSGLGGVGYRAIRSLVTNFESGSDRFLKKAQRGWSDSAQNGDQILSGLELAFAYALQFLAYNAANFGGVRFARFAGNKFNQGLSFIPGIGFARAFEAEFDPDRIRAKEAFIDSIQRNQLVGVMLSIGGYYILKAIADEPDDEKRGWFINGGWGNLTPEKKQQKLAAGEKEYTIGINGKVFNYANWPISSALAAIGSLSDLIRFSPDQWKDKNVTQIMASAAMSGAAAAADIPALSQFQELFGNSLSSKDPNEKRMERFAKVMSSYAGGFVPRFLKDIDYAQDPNLRKYETLWEKTASHIPVYRRYEGKEYYDILGQQIQRNIYPGSREFMVKPTDPAYKVLGALNSRGIWLTPANAEHRMVGKGARRRSLTQEEADNYSLETGKGYKQMLLRYGQRALQMPTERAKAFLLDKADDVRDRALKKVYRGYTPAS